MENKYILSGIEEQLYISLTNIDVALRPEKRVLYEEFSHVTNLLKEHLKLCGSYMINRRLAKNLLYTFTHIINEMDYASDLKKQELVKVLLEYEQDIISFLFAGNVQNDVDDLFNYARGIGLTDVIQELTMNLQNHTFRKLDYKLKLKPILRELSQKISKEEVISKLLAYELFILLKEVYWSTTLIHNDVLYLVSVSDVYLDVSRYVEDIFGAE
ncbi:hypothetical protein M5X11_37370 [Paenibacillus alginolyticus]|uniref:hypothetical protein n=1 Tax=Paenibacillus alginolyticus TaxID=59839 RepID=UPI0003F64A5D|nr:hypothetical protein [Paenibacillus alginolyticus]MCY9670506.1 hypothetical protein [Paenibacillus alginolyticus]